MLLPCAARAERDPQRLVDCHGVVLAPGQLARPEISHTDERVAEAAGERATPKSKPAPTAAGESPTGDALQRAPEVMPGDPVAHVEQDGVLEVSLRAHQ